MTAPPPSTGPGAPEPAEEDPLARRLLAIQDVMFRFQRPAAWGLAVAALGIGLAHLLFEVGNYPTPGERVAAGRFFLIFAGVASIMALLLRYLREMARNQVRQTVALWRRWRGRPPQP